MSLMLPSNVGKSSELTLVMLPLTFYWVSPIILWSFLCCQKMTRSLLSSRKLLLKAFELSMSSQACLKFMLSDWYGIKSLQLLRCLIMSCCKAFQHRLLISAAHCQMIFTPLHSRLLELWHLQPVPPLNALSSSCIWLPCCWMTLIASTISRRVSLVYWVSFECILPYGLTAYLIEFRY